MFSERLVLDDGVALELRFSSPRDYRLACLERGEVLVEFTGARPYQFKSVEKLRYDFEQAVDEALHRR